MNSEVAKFLSEHAIVPRSDESKMRVALASWEIGRPSSGIGAKVGGLGVIVEELPPELVAAGRHLEMDVEVVTLSPCFGSYDRSQLTNLNQSFTAVIDEAPHHFELYEHVFDGGQRVLYFWNERWLGALGPPTNYRPVKNSQVYPSDDIALRSYAAVCQAMAQFLDRDETFDTLHIHDYHVGLIPFYLSSKTVPRLPFHMTVHNASYQGVYSTTDGPALLAALNLQGSLYDRYFRFFENINLLRATMNRTHELGGKVTTVSGDLDASWGYAKELREGEAELFARVRQIDPNLRYQSDEVIRQSVEIPSNGLTEFTQIPVIGITNGIADENKAERSSWLQATRLAQHARFSHPEVQQALTTADHNFSAGELSNKRKLKRLLHLEAFGTEPEADTVLLVVVGRLVSQKSLHLVAEIIPRIRKTFPQAKFVILGSAPGYVDDATGQFSYEDPMGERAVNAFEKAAKSDPTGVFFKNGFDLALSKLIIAGGDFSFIPSRFEPCGIVDYESALMGTIVIGRLTGGLAKVSNFSFMYEWYNLGDEAGEKNALYQITAEALSAFRDRPDQIQRMQRDAMTLDGSWHKSATEYLKMYQFGRLMSAYQNSIQAGTSQFLAGCTPSHLRVLRKFLQAGSGQQLSVLLQKLSDQLDENIGDEHR